MFASVYIHRGNMIVDARNISFVGNFIRLSFLLFALEDGLRSFAMVGFLDSMAQQEMLQVYVIRTGNLLRFDILVVL
jgi:hypothetical protein